MFRIVTLPVPPHHRVVVTIDDIFQLTCSDMNIKSFICPVSPLKKGSKIPGVQLSQIFVCCCNEKAILIQSPFIAHSQATTVVVNVLCNVFACSCVDCGFQRKIYYHFSLVAFLRDFLALLLSFLQFVVTHFFALPLSLVYILHILFRDASANALSLLWLSWQSGLGIDD